MHQLIECEIETASVMSWQSRMASVRYPSNGCFEGISDEPVSADGTTQELARKALQLRRSGQSAVNARPVLPVSATGVNL